jgi:hypothetical protein
MEIQIKASKSTKLCIIYHPNPAEIEKQVEQIRALLKDA